MVRILANGDIVPDDDPRAQAQSYRNQPTRSRAPRQDGGEQYAQQGQSVSLFQVLNQKLLDFGIPRWNIGEVVIEPIVSVGLLLALLLFGIQGIIFGAILFAVSHWSMHGAPDFISNLFGNAGDNDNVRNRNQGRAGGGHRLGR